MELVMKKMIWIMGLLLVSLASQAQKVLVSGQVIDDKTGEHISHAIVTLGKKHPSVVTNDDGFFTLKTDSPPEFVTVSHLGYKTRTMKLSGKSVDGLVIRLSSTSIQLKEVVVTNVDPYELVKRAIEKVPENYSNTPELYKCFYRETAMKRQHFIYVAEGVMDMYKTSYSKNIYSDRVAIQKGRRLLSTKQSDTLGVKVMGGPVLPVQLDIVKNVDFLFNAEELSNYSFSLCPPVPIAERMQYVVQIDPLRQLPYALFHGKLYIDRENLAFTRIELTLDMNSKDKATQYMLRKKPIGVKFKPKELSCVIDYRYEDGVSHISYICNTFRFNCDWKRKLFSTSFAAFCEMVVTERTDKNVRPPSGRNSFDSRDSFYDKVEYFRDPDFWNDYNIIEPTESLDKAIGKLVKKYK